MDQPVHRDRHYKPWFQPSVLRRWQSYTVISTTERDEVKMAHVEVGVSN